MENGMSGVAIISMFVGITIIWGGLFLSIFYAMMLSKFRNTQKNQS